MFRWLMAFYWGKLISLNNSRFRLRRPWWLTTPLELKTMVGFCPLEDGSSRRREKKIDFYLRTRIRVFYGILLEWYRHWGRIFAAVRLSRRVLSYMEHMLKLMAMACYQLRRFSMPKCKKYSTSKYLHVINKSTI